MNTKSNSATGDRRVVAGLFQWREGNKSHFEHCIESAMSAQEDYNKFAQQLSQSKTPYDLAVAWSELVQCRVSHIGLAFNQAINNGGDLKSSIHRAT